MLRALWIAILLTAASQAGSPSFERLSRKDWKGSLVSGDFDRDGNVDLVEITGSALTFRAGRGDGTFEEKSRTSVPGAEVYSFLAADFDGDGNLDLAASSWDEPVVSVWIGDGRGSFAPLPGIRFPKPPTPGPWAWIEGIAAADLNGDGNIDLMVQVLGYDLDGGSGPFYVLFGHGNGRFTAGPPFLSGIWANFLLTDVDGDGMVDLVVRWALGTSMIYHSNGDGTFRRIGGLPIDDTFWEDGMAAGDFNRDGIMDLAVVDRGAVVILLGSGDGTFRVKARVPTAKETGGIAIADVNGDGWPDLLIRFGYSTPGTMYLACGNGDGTFQNPFGLDAGDGVLVADFDGDGRPDLLLQEWRAESASVLLNRTPVEFAPTLIRSAAGTAVGGIAPDMLISIYGSFLGNAARPERTKVRINGSDAKVLYVSGQQINAQAGLSVGAPGEGHLVVEGPAGTIEATVKIGEYAPVIFRLNGNEGAILHADNSPVTAAWPARVGETVTMLCTGLGHLWERPTVSVGGKPSAVLSAGISGESTLLNRIQFVIPDIGAGDRVPVQLTIGGVGSNMVTIAMVE